MSRDSEEFAQATEKLRAVDSRSEGNYLHEYDAVLTDTDETVRVITLAPELADDEAATDAFERVTGQWYNANTHRDIVSIVERETTPRPWIALDQSHDLTLDRVQSRLSPTDLETVITGTAEALRTLGLYNAVHGTLTPEDILVYADGDETVVQVGGFGVEHAVRTALGEFSPTPYTAPELLDEPEKPTEQTDVYGLGAITYFALTGHPPVDGDTLDQAIRDGPASPPSEYNDETGSGLDKVVMQALSTHPGDRYDSPYAFRRAFLSAFAPEEPEPDDASEDSDEEAETAEAAESGGAASNENDTDSPSDDSADEPDTEQTSVSRRAAVGLLGMGVLAGGGWYLSRGQRTAGGKSNQTTTPGGQPTPTSSETTTEPEAPLQNPTQQAKLASDDGDSFDQFGFSVALSSDGSTALIGAYGDEDPNGNYAGSAYVFDSAGGSWTQQAKLAPDDGDMYDLFGGFAALSSDGSTALIGAYGDEDPNGDSAGSAYVFDSSGGSWTQQAKLTADDGDSRDWFGTSVALSSDGTTALIGAWNDEDPNGEGDSSFSGAGSAYVFDSAGGSWTQQAKLAADDGDSDDKFGGAVSLSSDGATALIGASNDEDPNGEGAGSAYVFDSSGGSWTQQVKLTPDDGDSGDDFGQSVALSSDGSIALIGAYGHDDPNGDSAGSAYVFDNSAGSWTQQAKIAADDGDSDDHFGVSVTLSSDGTTALIGAADDEDPNGEGAGSAYLFDSAEGSWTQQAKLAANDGDSGDDFGNELALSGDGATALIGAADDEDPNGSGNRRYSGAGSAYVFK